MSSQRYTIKPQDFQKLNSKLLYISTSKYEGDWHSIPHSHHFSELFYVISGTGSFLLEDQVFSIHTNDLVIVTPNTEHTEQSLNANPLEYIVLGIDGITFLNLDQSNSHVIYNYSERKEILSLFTLLLNEIQDEQPGYNIICQNLLDIVLIQIIRMQNLVPASISSTKMTKECGQVKRYLEANYSDNISLDSLAAMTHMNKYYLVHAFTKYTGMSPINYLTMKRLQVSQELLSSTDYSIAQISSSVGFSSQSYFSQVFKKETSMTPNEYRKHKNKEST